MAYQPKPGDGSLFINKKKTKDTHPDRTGSALIHCPNCSCNFPVKLAGWGRQKDDGEKWLSMKIESKEDPGAYRGEQQPATGGPVSSAGRESARRSRPMPPPPTDAQTDTPAERQQDPLDQDGNAIF